MKEKTKYLNKEEEMKALRLTLGLVFIFLLFNTLGFAQNPLSMKDQVMPPISSSGVFTTAEEAVKTLHLEIGKEGEEIPVEVYRNFKVVSQEEGKTILESVDTKEKIQLACTETGTVIEYGGTTLTFDSNVDIGNIVVDKNGVLTVYDKDNNIIAQINKDGGGNALIGGMYVTFAKGATVALKGDEQGKINAVEVKTEAGSYIIEKTSDGNIKVTSAGGDTFSFNPEDFNWKGLYIRADGSALLEVVSMSDNQGAISVEFDSKGKATSISVYDSNFNEHTTALEREDGVNLNINVNNDLSVTAASSVENSVKLKFKQDGSVEAIKPDGTVVPITGDIEKATFNKNGSVKINMKGGAVITVNPGENPDNPGWWDGMTADQIASALQDLVKKGKLDEAAKKYTELAKADVNLAAQAMQKMQTNTAAKIVNKLDVGLAADVLEKLDAQKVADILTAKDYKIKLPHGSKGKLPSPTTPNIISADKAGQILAAMDKQKAADALGTIKPQDAVPIVKAMLNNKGVGVQKVADIMKLMDPGKVAAIMAVPNRDKPRWPIWGRDRDDYLPTQGLSVKECTDILRAMGGLQEPKVMSILFNLFTLRPWKAITIFFMLFSDRFTLPQTKAGAK